MGKATKKRPSAVVFELEYVGTSGRELVFEAMRGVLGKKEIELTFAQFMRFGPDRHPQDHVLALLKAGSKDRLSDAKTVDDVKAAIAAGFAKSSLKAAAGLKKLLSAAATRGMALGCVSALERDAMQELVVTLGLGDLGVELMSNSGGRLAVPGTDVWIKLAKMTGVHPTRCLTLVGSSISCRSALLAHMHCVAVPDRFTECADFGGADFVVNSLDEIDSAGAFAVLETGL